MRLLDPDEIELELKKHVQGSETFDEMMQKIAIYIVKNYQSKNDEIEEVEFKDIEEV